MTTDLTKLYMQLNDMSQTKEVTQVKNQIREALYQRLKENVMDFTAIGRVIGYTEMQQELTKAIALLEMYKADS